MLPVFSVTYVPGCSSLTLEARRPKHDQQSNGQDSDHSGSNCSRQDIANRGEETRSFNHSP